MKITHAFTVLVSFVFTWWRSQDKARARHDWPVWGGQPENMHYSKLAQLNRENRN